MIPASNLESALKLYKQVVTPELVESILKSTEIAAEQRSSIFSTAVVVWLMIFQRLSGDHTLSAAIEHLKVFDIRELLLSSEAKSIKARHGRISSNTGGYSQGRQRVPLLMVEQITDVLNEALSKATCKQKPAEQPGEKIYALDGTTILISCSEGNVDEYAQHKTRLGVSHYPLTRVTLATEVTSGVAMRPVVGAHNGSKAISEIMQAHELLPKLEQGSIILADRLYGVTQIVHKTGELGQRLVVRVRDSIANRLVKTRRKESGDIEVVWRASAYEQERYPHLVGVEIRGRCIWKTIRRAGFRPLKLVLFTTCDKPTEEVVALYGLRWNIEKDLHDLKTTLQLNFINAKSPDMVKKEIFTGVSAYNLVRHFMKVAARQLSSSVRSLSFKAVLRRLTTLENTILSSACDEKGNARFSRSTEIALTDLKVLLLPVRKNTRPSQPREKWRKGVQHFRRSTKS